MGQKSRDAQGRLSYNAAMKRKWPVLVAILSVAFVAPAALARASITESKDDLLPSTRSGLYSWAKEHGAPAGPLGRSDRLLLVQAGAAFAEIILIGPAGSEMLYDARTLRDELGAGTIVEYGEEEEGSVVVATLANNEFLKRHSVTTVPAGRIVRALQARGYHVFSFVRARKYAAVTGLKQLDETRRWRYFELTGESDATFEASLAGPELWGPALMMFGPLVCLLLGFGAATIYARQTEIEVERRRAAYRKLVLWPVFGSIAVCLPFSMWLIIDGHLYPLGDLWFGSASVSPFILLLMPTLLIPLIALVPMTKVETRLFGPNPNEPLAPSRMESKEVGKGLVKWSILIPIALFVLWLLSVNLVPRELKWVSQTLYVLAIASPPLVPSLVNILLKLRRTSLLEVDPSDPVLQEVSDVAGKVGARVRKLTIVEPAVEHADPTCFSSHGVVTVNRPFLELPEGERRFGLALALGHNPGRSVFKHMMLIVPIAAGFALLMAFGPTSLKSLGPLLLLAPMALFLPILLWWTPRSFRQDIRRSMIRALTICQDVEAARRFIARSLEGEAFNGAGLSVRAERRRKDFLELFESAVAEYEANVGSA